MQVLKIGLEKCATKKTAAQNFCFKPILKSSQLTQNSTFFAKCLGNPLLMFQTQDYLQSLHKPNEAFKDTISIILLVTNFTSLVSYYNSWKKLIKYLTVQLGEHLWQNFSGRIVEAVSNWGSPMLNSFLRAI